MEQAVTIFDAVRDRLANEPTVALLCAFYWLSQLVMWLDITRQMRRWRGW